MCFGFREYSYWMAVVHIECQWSKRWRNDLSEEITDVSALSLDLRYSIDDRGHSKPIPHIQLIALS